MRVIAPADMNWSLETACGDCGTKVEIDTGDLQRMDGDTRDPRDLGGYVWRCPTCSRENMLALWVVPRHIARRIP